MTSSTENVIYTAIWTSVCHEWKKSFSNTSPIEFEQKCKKWAITETTYSTVSSLSEQAHTASHIFLMLLMNKYMG